MKIKFICGYCKKETDKLDLNKKGNMIRCPHCAIIQEFKGILNINKIEEEQKRRNQ